jgi:cell division initiation protein
MKITPIEIRQKTFEKGFRGYEKEEVDNFLNSLSREWEKLMEDNRQLQKKLEVSEKEVQRLQEVENSLHKTLKSAETAGASVIEQANKAAELYLREAQIKAEALLNDARNKAKNIIEEAEEKTDILVDEVEGQLRGLIREYNYLEDQKDNLLQVLKQLAGDTMDRIARVKEKTEKTDLEKKLKELKDIQFQKKPSEAFELKMDSPLNEADYVIKNREKKKGENIKTDNKENSSGSFFDTL